MTKNGKTFKDGDLYAGRPVRVLSDPLEAAQAAVLGVDPDVVSSLYGNQRQPAQVKGSPQAKAAMAKVRAKRGKSNAKEKNDVDETEGSE